MKKVIMKICSVVLIALMLVTISLTGVFSATYIVDDGFKFTRDTNNNITIHEYVGTDAVVNVPSSLLNQKVASINEYAFMYNDVITSMTIPNTITILNRGIFYGCPNLKTVQLPKNCTQIGQYMFYECSSLESVTLPSMLKEVPRYCFAHCDSLEAVTLPSTAKVIGDYAFSDCPELKEVYVSKYTNSISLTAFEDSPQAVICGYMNTYAHEFAIENSIPFSAVDANAETLYVTFYDYDGSVFMNVPVTKGSSIRFPSVTPEKPATSTHYYEFSYWDGNVNNIQKNEFVYPVYTEHEIIEIPEEKNKYSVVFLDGDDVFMDVQLVEEGANAAEPESTPTKTPTKSHNYVFANWDKSFENVTQNLIIRPVFEEQLIEYTVRFVDENEEVLSEQVLHYGESAVAPEAPAREGYTFAGWDKEFDFISEDLTITALYEENEAPKEPVPAKTTGKLRIELAGGSSFTIAVNGGAARPQGSSYTNTKMPVGATVTVVANATSGIEFIGWMDEYGAILSPTDTYTFVASGNDYLKACYQTEVEGVNSVIFKNAKASGGNGAILDMQYYASGDEIAFPSAPSQAGYTFSGWSMTTEDIQQKLTAGEDVTVLAKWEVAKVYIDVTVNGGEISTAAQPNGQYLAYNALTVVAGEASEGQKFAYWTDVDGTIVSYDAEYKFYPSKDTELTAVYVSSGETVVKKPLAFIAGDPSDMNTEAIMYTMSWDIDEAIGTVTAAGLMWINEADYNEDTFKHGSGDVKLFDRTFAAQFIKQKNTYSINKTGSLYGNTYVACLFVIYTDATTGESVTIYSDSVAIIKPAP